MFGFLRLVFIVILCAFAYGTVSAIYSSLPAQRIADGARIVSESAGPPIAAVPKSKLAQIEEEFGMPLHQRAADPEPPRFDIEITCALVAPARVSPHANAACYEAERRAHTTLAIEWPTIPGDFRRWCRKAEFPAFADERSYVKLLRCIDRYRWL